MIRSLLDLMKTAEGHLSYLKGKGVRFDKRGFPVLPKQAFLDSWPEQIVPFDFGNSRLVQNPSKTLLCFYCADKRIYPRFEKVLDEISEYKRFMGVVAVDVSITSDMGAEWQSFIMLLQQLFLAVLYVNDVPVVANLRIGNAESASYLDGVPKGVMWAAGFLGCVKEKERNMDFIATVLRVLPSKLIVYGSEDCFAFQKLERMGVEFRLYPDYHKQCGALRKSEKDV